MRIYEWDQRGHSVAAQLVGDTVERLAKEGGGVCPPAALVKEARPAESPLHVLFEWDDATAAERFRENQARQVIRSIRVVVDETDEPSIAFVSVTIEEHRGYAPIDVVIAEPTLAEQAEREALAALQGLRRRYAHLTKLQQIWAAIDDATSEDG